MNTKQQLIVALDLPGREEILNTVRLVKDHIAMVKIGLEGYTAHGPDLVREVVDSGVDVFLDLKLHDIPRTVGAAARALKNVGIKLVTVHASGGQEMIEAVVNELPDVSVIAVTVLTSLTDKDLASIGYLRGVDSLVRTLTYKAMNARAAGVVCSAHELYDLSDFGGLRVVPGIRLSGESSNDHKRVATPEQAIKDGATWIVMGRSIVQASDPLKVIESLNEKT
jgi:orotidine-5'-phosphate decarboxylase